MPGCPEGMQSSSNSFTPGRRVRRYRFRLMPFFDVLHVTGRQRVEVPMVQQDARDATWAGPDALQAAFVRAGSVIICNPNNPLGTAFTEAELRAIVDISPPRRPGDRG